MVVGSTMRKLHLREGEGERTWFRSDRFFTVESDHFFSTREGVDVGPFPSRAAAERGLQLYIKVMQKEEAAGMYASKIAMQGLWASTGYH